MKQKSVHVLGLSVAIACALALTACSSGNGAGSGPTQLVMTIWGSDNDTKTYQERADAYTVTNPDVKVTVRNIPVDNYAQQVNTMLSGGDAPDLILVDGNSAPGLASRGALVDLSPLIQAANLDPASVVDAGRLTGYALNGKQYALPDRGGNIVFYYNKTMFDAAGVAYPTAGWTWDQMVSAAQKLTIREGDQTTQWGVAVDDWPNATASVLTSFGCVWFNDDMTKSTVDSPECQNGLQKYGDLSLTLKVSPTLQEYADYGQNVNRDALFAQSQAAMIWAGVWDVPDFVAQGLSFGLVPPPIGVAGNPNMQAFGTGIAIASASKNQDAAWGVLQYMFSPDGQRPIVTNQQDVPSAKVLMSDWQANLPAGVTYDEVLKAGDLVFSQAAPPQIGEITQQFQKDLNPFFNGQATAADTLTKAAASMNSILSS